MGSCSQGIYNLGLLKKQIHNDELWREPRKGPSPGQRAEGSQLSLKSLSLVLILTLAGGRAPSQSTDVPSPLLFQTSRPSKSHGQSAKKLHPLNRTSKHPGFRTHFPTYYFINMPIGPSTEHL